MKQIKDGELFEHLGGFLKAKGIELKEGSYVKRIQQGCALISETINVSQQGLQSAKSGADRKLDQLRQIIHEKTAPKGSPPPATGSAAPAAQSKSRPARPKPNPRKATKPKAKTPGKK